jgi:AsmA protein
MSRIFKVLGLVVGAVAALVVIAVVLIVMFFDPNDYRDEIVAAVGDATGREFTLEGDLELAVFPRIRIAMGPASLSNAPGFGTAPFARIDGAELQVEVLPLLSRRVSIGQARLTGLELNLARGANGINNWQDLGSSSPSAAAPAAQSGSDADTAAGGGNLDLDVARLQIEDAEVSWRDAAAGTQWRLTGFNLDASNFGPGATFPLSIDFELAGDAIQVAVASSMRATLSLAENSYRLDDLEVNIEGEGTGWPGGAGKATLAFDSFVANLDDATLALENLRLGMLGLQVNGTLQGERLFTSLRLTGGIEIAEFDPNDLLEIFDAEIETADDSVFRRASARADFIYDSTQMGMRNMQLVLDDSTLVGSLGMQGETLRFGLEVDAINIDRYLPPATEDVENEDEGSIDEVDLPLEPLRTLSANGTLALGEAQFLGMTFEDAKFTLTAGDGTMRLTPTGSLYGGAIDGEIRIAVQGDTARFGLRQSLTNVDLLGLGRDFLGTGDSLTGKGNINLDVAANGSNVGALKRDLDGNVSFALTDGAWSGIDAWYELRRARAVLGGGSAPPREGPAQTTFSNVSASGMVVDGLLTTNNVNATLPFMGLTGTGTVNLLTNDIAFEMTAALTDGPTLQSDPAMAEYAGASLPLTVGGTLDAPSIRPAFGAAVRARVQQEVQTRVDEERSEVNQRVEEQRAEADERLDERREEVQDRVRDRLRGILDR